MYLIINNSNVLLSVLEKGQYQSMKLLFFTGCQGLEAPVGNSKTVLPPTRKYKSRIWDQYEIIIGNCRLLEN